MVIDPDVRRLFALLGACGLAVSAFSYVESFSTERMDTIFRSSVILVPIWMALLIPMYAIEYPASRAWNFAWKVLARGMPRWVAPSFNLLLLISLGHILWFAVHAGGWGAPDIWDGQYVLAARGHILKTLTQTEYLELRAAEARMFATAMFSLFFPLTMYWWFRRNDGHAVREARINEN